jgi:hypothetical protein
MIQQSRHSIYVHLPNGESVPLLPQTVAETFALTQCAGEELEPWQLQELAEALIYYLRTDQEENWIEYADLVSALGKLARACGFNSVTVQKDAIVSADLYRMAQSTGYGFELAFFRTIESSIHELRSRNARVVRFVGLRSSVKMLVGARNWCKSCQRMSDEIVAFIRSHMQHWSHERPVIFAVS